MHPGLVAVVIAETAVSVETDGVFPTVVRLNADSAESLTPGYVEYVRDQGTTNAPASMRFANGHAHNTPALVALRNQRGGANQFAADFCDKERMALLDIVASDVVKVWITSLVNPPKMLAKTGLNQSARCCLVARLKGTNDK